MQGTNPIFILEFSVRDYECDLQGIVNNAVYQHYLEHTRHEYLKAVGLDFAELHRQGIDAVVTRIEMEYKLPLTSGDKFLVTLSQERKGRLQIIFCQDILRLPDRKLMLTARVTAAVLENGKPVLPDNLLRAMAAFAQSSG